MDQSAATALDAESSIGFLEVCTQSRVVGWVRCATLCPEVEIAINGHSAASVPCDREREDLLEIAGREARGFVHRFSSLVAPGQLISVKSRSGSPLGGSPRQPIGHEGNLESYQNGLVAGWAEVKGEPANVLIFADDVLVGRIECNISRPDFISQGLHPAVGFTFRLPRLAARPVSISARFENGANLWNSPVRLAPAPPARGFPNNSLIGTGTPIIIVIGMHRSGTSLCSNVLNLLGVDMSDDIQVAPSNARGHWERKELVAFHDRILQHFGRGWYEATHALPLPDHWWADYEVETVRQEIISWLSARMPTSAKFGFKDPRTSRLLPLWDQICCDLSIQPRFVFCLRNPVQVARSLEARDAISWPDSLFRWMTYNCHAIQSLQDKQVSIIPYETWFTEPNRNLETLAAATDSSWSELTAQVKAKLMAAVDVSLRHDDADALRFSDPVTIGLYNDLMSAAGTGRIGRPASDKAAAFLEFVRFTLPLLEPKSKQWQLPKPPE